MKINKIMIMLIGLFVFFTLGTSCEKEKRYQRKIVGVWKCISKSVFSGCGPIMYFGENNNYYEIGTIVKKYEHCFNKKSDKYCEKRNKGEVFIKKAGNYKLEDNTVYLTYTIEDSCSSKYKTLSHDTFIIDKFGWTPNRGKILKYHTLNGKEKKYEICPGGFFKNAKLSKE